MGFWTNWWGYTNVLLNQRPYVRYGINLFSISVAAYVAWPITLGFQSVSMLAMSGVMTHFVTYGVVGSLNYLQKIYTAFRVLTKHFNDWDDLEEGKHNLDKNVLFEKLFNDNQIAITLSLSVQQRFEKWVLNYVGNRVPSNFDLEIDGFLAAVINSEEIGFLMPHVERAFKLLTKRYHNEGRQEEDPVFTEIKETFEGLKRNFTEKYLVVNLKNILNTEENRQYFFSNVFNVMIKNHLDGIDPLVVLGIDDKKPTRKLIANKFAQLMKGNRDVVLHSAGNQEFDVGKVRIAKEIALMRSGLK